MSSPNKEKVTCRYCKALLDRWCWRMIDLRRHPEALEKLRSRVYFKSLCPCCGHAVYEEYSMVCYDSKKGAHIQFVAKDDLEPFFYLDEMLKRGQRLSRVYDVDDLIEKVIALQNGRDDRIVEMCKLWSSRQFFIRTKSFQVDRMYYSVEDGKEKIVFENEDGIRVITEFPESLYRLFKRAFREVLPRVKTRSNEYDAFWASGFIRNHLELLWRCARELGEKGE